MWGDIFSETRLDDGLHSIDEQDLAKQQKLIGSMAHLALQGVEGSTTLYKKLSNFVLVGKKQAVTENLEYTVRRTQNTLL